jgi:hypothetical protein
MPEMEKLSVVIRMSCGHARHEMPPVKKGQDTFCHECVATVQIVKVSR